jgi:predicted alpha/beta hydrolase family esterase
MTNINLPNAVFIHCSGTQSGDHGSTPLINYLKIETKSELNILHPSMPDPRSPSYGAWEKVIENANLSQCSIVIGHSLGASVILKYLSEQKPFLALDALFLIATPFWGLRDWTHGDYVLKADFPKALVNVKRIFFYHSNDDHVVPVHHLEAYSSCLPGATARRLNGQGHYFTKGIPVLIEDLKRSSVGKSESRIDIS